MTKADTKDSSDKFGNIMNDTKFYMNGPSVFNFSINTAPKNILDLLRKENVKIEDIDFFILHQANKLILDTIRKKLGVPEEKFIMNIDRYGNTVASSIPIALGEAASMNVIKKGDKILLSAFGVGYSWASVIITY